MVSWGLSKVECIISKGPFNTQQGIHIYTVLLKKIRVNDMMVQDDFYT